MEFEKSPAPSSVPVLFVVQEIGAERLVELNQVYGLFGIPPVPVSMRLPPETVGVASVGGTATNFSKRIALY